MKKRSRTAKLVKAQLLHSLIGAVRRRSLLLKERLTDAQLNAARKLT